MKQQKLNVRLIRRIIKHILAEPKRYCQEDTIANGEPGELILGVNYNQKFATCGTAACIGGWAYLLSEKHPTSHWDTCTILDKGGRALGLTDYQQEVLFTGLPGAEWPQPYAENYRKAKTPAGRTRTAVRLLEKVIETKGNVLSIEHLPMKEEIR
jgi:hypothetical protein